MRVYVVEVAFDVKEKAQAFADNLADVNLGSYKFQTTTDEWYGIVNVIEKN